MTIPDELVEIGARSDADFDGRPYDSLGRADRNRYFERHKAAITAVIPHLAKMMMEPTRDMLGSTHRALEAYLGDSLTVSDRDVSESVWKAMLAAFFKERFGIEIKD